MNLDNELYGKCIRYGILDNNDNLLVDFRQYKNYDTFLEETGLTLTEGIRVLDYCISKSQPKNKKIVEHFHIDKDIKFYNKELIYKLLGQKPCNHR